MKCQYSRTILVLPVAVLMGCTSALAGKSTGSFEQALAVDTPVQIDVRTGSGSISVQQGQADQVEVFGTIVVNRGAGLFSHSTEDAEELIRQVKANPPVQYADGRLRIGHIENPKLRKNVSLSYRITVPFDTQIRSHTGSGSQDLAGISGPADASTGSGDLTFTDISGAVEARTGSGSIRAEGISGDFMANTGSGGVRLDQAGPGDVDARSGSGQIVLRGINGALRADSGSGGIEVEGRQTGPWELDTGSGSVRISLPGDAAFELDAESNSGDIDIDHPITVQGMISEDRLKGEVRGGGALLRVRTGSGDIRIK